MLKFNRLGRIEIREFQNPVFKSHFALPTPVKLGQDVWLYFSVRDQKNRGHIFRCLWQESKPLELRSPELVLSPGEGFDKDGCSVGQVIGFDNKIYLYYLGWNLKAEVPWQNQIGLAISQDNRIFTKAEYPLLALNEDDPFSMSYPFIFQNHGQSQLFYGSNLSWGSTVDDMKHVIKQRSSHRHFSFPNPPTIALGLRGTETGISRPWIMQRSDQYLFLVGVKDRTYQIKAYDFDETKGQVGAPVKIAWQGAKKDWDSLEQSYPAVYQGEDNDYLFYCGNKYGETGFGVAVIE